MAMLDTLNAGPTNPTWKDYLTLTKPRVVAVLVLTSMVGMLLARPVLPPIELFILANFGYRTCCISCGRCESCRRSAP